MTQILIFCGLASLFCSLYTLILPAYDARKSALADRSSRRAMTPSLAESNVLGGKKVSV